MQALALFLLSVLAACRADTLSQLESYCIRECGTPEYDQLVEELDHQDELLNEVATKAMNLEHKLDEWKHELEEADKESKNMLLRLDRLHSDKEEAVCPKKHFKCLKGDSKRHEKCISDILVCDGEPDCLDGSDEDENLCIVPIKAGSEWHGRLVNVNCTVAQPEFMKVTCDSVERKIHDAVNAYKINLRVFYYFPPGVSVNDVQVGMLPVSLRYVSATREMKGNAEFLGIIFKVIVAYSALDEGFIYTASYGSSGQECYRAVLTPDNE